MRNLQQIQDILAKHNPVDIETGIDGGACCIVFSSYLASIMWSFGAGWEHVSIAPLKKDITPSWSDMCQLKDMFFNDDEAVIQIHPVKDEYVNNINNCLHLWRCTYTNIALPPSCLIGLKKGQTMAELDREYDEYCKYIKTESEIHNESSSENPNKTGHWRHYENMLYCSECGEAYYDDIMEYCGDDVPKYCPMCGSRMMREGKECQ